MTGISPFSTTGLFISERPESTSTMDRRMRESPDRYSRISPEMGSKLAVLICLMRPGIHTTGGIQVVDNHLYGLPVEYQGGVAILAGYVADSDISHNQIDHIPYTAISMGWGGWGDKAQQPPVPNFSHHNVVSHNVIYDFMEILTDGGGIYTLGITGTSLADGQQVTGNIIHGQLGWSSALKSDNGATFVTYSRNVLYDNTYDWDGYHYDYRMHPGTHHPTTYDPEAVVDNYWQQGGPNSSQRLVTARGNVIITGPGQAPPSIVDDAGIEPDLRSILEWRPRTIAAPIPPQGVAALYAFRGTAYVTWRPSFAEGSNAVISYTITPCRATATVTGIHCQASPSAAVTISDGKFALLGYALVPGLTNGTTYAFTVNANSRAGSSIPSLPSSTIVVGAKVPVVPERPSGVLPQSGKQLVRLMWYPPKVTGCPFGSYDSWRGCNAPVLAYVITTSSGGRYTASGLSQLIVSNHEGRSLRVIGGLRSDERTGSPWRRLIPPA